MMGLSSAVLFIFIFLLTQSGQEVTGQSENFLPGDRVKVFGISRLELGSFFSAFRVTVVPSVDIPERLHSKILICFHRNKALGWCQCKKNEWKAIQKGRRSFVMSPYDDKYVDVKFIDGVKGSFFLTVDEDSQPWRLFFLALGLVLLLLAPIASWVPFYYICSMVIGVSLVILIILVQGMKLLSTGRKILLYLTIYDSVLGVGSFLLHHFSVLVNSILLHFGMPEEMHNLVSVFLLFGIVLSGGPLSFWIVRKFIISQDGSVDVGVAQFVKWAMRIIGTSSILQCTLDTPSALGAMVAGWTLCSLINSLKSGGMWQFTISVDGRSVDVGVARFVKWAMRIVGTTLILQCTLDTPLALGAVVVCWTLCSLIHSLMSEGVRYHTFGFHDISLGRNEQDISRRTCAEFLSRSRAQRRRRMLGSSNSRLAWSDSPLEVNAAMNMSSSGMQNQKEYYSTFHKLRNRKKFTKKEWNDLTKESPWEALAEWAASPEFTDWIIEHAVRIQLLINDSYDEVMASEFDSIDEKAGGRAGGFQLCDGRNDQKKRD